MTSRRPAIEDAHLGPAREGSRIIVFFVGALHLAHSENTGLVVGAEGPISNSLTAVAACRSL